jgi:hypothetical protein
MREGRLRVRERGVLGGRGGWRMGSGGRMVETAALSVSEGFDCKVQALAEGVDGVTLTSKVVESTLRA